ncbi:MAG TPA: hypothetical protein VGQ48_06850 [Gemmatimonadales bacterium]|jgi:hypothetical protein|nr:hypothetical protein [Gemmatimonadales bacterium]
MTWWQALIAAGAVPGSGGKGDAPEAADHADLVEGTELQAYSVGPAQIPAEVSFLNGIERWNVVAYDGVAQIVNAFVAAAVRRRDKNGVLHTTAERNRAFAMAPLESMTPALREILEQSGADVEPMDGALAGQPARYLEQVESTVRRVRAHLERELADACLNDLGADEWLVLDGLLSRSPAVARHPRALGVITSHGAQFLEGRGLERALTLPAGYRTSVFAVRGGHTRTEVYSWYQRLWPWEGNDLLYGLLRIEARAHPETVARASELSGWLWAERAPLATPATRWDRLLYPLHHVEEYLKALAPRDIRSHRASRLPRTGT